MDVLKLQKAYGCDGSCGGWAKSETGGLSHCLNFKKYCDKFPSSRPFVRYCNKQQQQSALKDNNNDNNGQHEKISGDLDGTSSDNESPCEWILETSPGKVGYTSDG